MHRPHSVSVPETLLPVVSTSTMVGNILCIPADPKICVGVKAEDKDTLQEDDLKKETILPNLLSNNSELTVTAHELFRKQGQT